MATLVVDNADPWSSAEYATIDVPRLTAISQRHQAIGELLRIEQLDAVLLQLPENIAWLTAGGAWKQGGITAGRFGLLITPNARVVLGNNVESPEIFEHHLAGLGFQLKERTWAEDRSMLPEDMCRGRRVVSDTGFAGTPNIGLRMLSLRLPFDEYDASRVSEAGRIIAHAVEATARGLVRDRKETEAAGELMHRLVKHDAEPVRVQILADGRASRFRHWTYSDSPIRRFATVACLARHRGLTIGACRTISFGAPPAELIRAHAAASEVLAVAWLHSQVDWEMYAAWNRLKKTYEKLGAPDDWRLSEQGTVVEYDFGAIPAVGNSEFKFGPGIAIHWRPAFGPAMAGETILIQERGPKLLTSTGNWPTISVDVKDRPVPVPGILELG